MLLLLLAIAAIRLGLTKRQEREQEHDKAVRLLGLTTNTGERFFHAIHSSPNRKLFRDHFRVDAEAFDELNETCKPHIRSSLRYPREVLAVALNWIGSAATCRTQEVLFDLAYSTVNKYRVHGVYAIVRALQDLVVMPSTVPSSFKAAHPYFDQALCAIDGTHFSIVVPSEDIKRYRNHKGFISTNVLIACDWSMNVCFIYPGAEGSAHDSMVLQWSRFLDMLPENFYVLADAGYGLSPQVLTPYRGVRYHLKEWASSSGRPRSGKELYNLRHAKARNVVERVIGLLKRRFRVFRSCMDYELRNIKAVIVTCALVHNFIRKFDESDLAADIEEDDDAESDASDDFSNDEHIAFDFRNGTSWRTWMTKEMWREYEEFRASDPMDCGQDNGESSDEIDQSSSDISMDSDIFSDIGMESNISSTSDNEDGG